MRAIARNVAAVDNFAVGSEERRLGGARFALDQREGHVAAENDPALAREPVGKAVGETSRPPAIAATPSAMQAMNT